MSGQYILNGKTPVKCNDLIKWAKQMEGKNRIVEQSQFGKVKVSTVFLGLDYSFGEEKPILYETLVMPDNQIHRYHTKKEALLGHKEIVKKLKNSFKLKESIIKKNGK